MLAVVKLGGNALGEGGDPVLADLVELREAGWSCVLVHGGGPDIDAALAVARIKTGRIEGLRITDAATLAVTEAALCATVNKRIVRQCLALGLPAAGISGQDGGTLVARQLEPIGGVQLGFVGEVQGVDPKLMNALLGGGFLPVVAPMAVSNDRLHAYNINADLAAGSIAGAMGADAYVVLTNVDYVLRDPEDPSSAIKSMTAAQAADFLQTPACASGMKPKMQSVLTALRGGVREAAICGARKGALFAALQDGAGTRVSG